MTSRPSTAAPILAVLAGVLVMQGPLVVAGAGCRGQIEETVTSQDNKVLKERKLIKDIHTAAELQAALSSPRAVIHLDVNWAAQAIQSRSVVHEFVESASRQSGLDDVAFFRLDCSEQEGPIWDALEAWQNREHSNPALRFGGYGAIVWIANGMQKDAVEYAHAVGNLPCRTSNVR